MKKVTPFTLLDKKKRGEKITALSAYDFSMASVIDRLGIDLVLVGDSLGMVLLGYESTLPVTMEEMLHHTRAVKRGVQHALVVADMPFMSYQVSSSQAVDNAGRFLKEAGAHAVKLEGGVEIDSTVKQLVDAGVPVLGHIGLKPQHVLKKGKYEVHGKSAAEREQIIEDAAALEASGAFGVVLEGIPSTLAKEITKAVSIPTIGIGAGPDCDGQILVLHDLIGFGLQRPKFVKAYAECGQELEKAVKKYKKDVEEGKFPDAKHSY